MSLARVGQALNGEPAIAPRADQAAAVWKIHSAVTNFDRRTMPRDGFGRPLTWGLNALWHIIDGFCGRVGFCWVGNRELCLRFGTTRRRLQDHLDELEDAGLIHRVRGDGPKVERLGIVMRSRPDPDARAARDDAALEVMTAELLQRREAQRQRAAERSRTLPLERARGAPPDDGFRGRAARPLERARGAPPDDGFRGRAARPLNKSLTLNQSHPEREPAGSEPDQRQRPEPKPIPTAEPGSNSRPPEDAAAAIPAAVPVPMAPPTALDGSESLPAAPASETPTEAPAESLAALWRAHRPRSGPPPDAQRGGRCHLAEPSREKLEEMAAAGDRAAVRELAQRARAAAAPPSPPADAPTAELLSALAVDNPSIVTRCAQRLADDLGDRHSLAFHERRCQETRDGTGPPAAELVRMYEAAIAPHVENRAGYFNDLLRRWHAQRR